MPKKRALKAEDLYRLSSVEDPRFSPDGRWIVFVHRTTDRRLNQYVRTLWLVSTAGRARPRWFSAGAPHQDFEPRISPNSRWLAFVSTRVQKPWKQPQIFLIPLAGGEAQRVTLRPTGAGSPAWSPDGMQLAFISRVNAAERRAEDRGRTLDLPDDAWEVQRMVDAREHAEQVRFDPRVVTRLPYRVETDFLDDRRAHIYVMAIDPERGEYGEPRRVTDGDVDFPGVDWSPDGRYLYSAAQRGSHPDTQSWGVDVVRITVKTGAVRRLTRPGFTCKLPVVSPDGKWLAFARIPEDSPTGRTVRLAVMPGQGGAVRELNLDLDRSVELIRWSPEGRWLYFQVGDQGHSQIYRVRPGGGAPQLVLDRRHLALGLDVSRAGRLVVSARTARRPPELYLTGGQGQGLRRVTHFHDELLNEVHVAPSERVAYKTPDGNRVQGWVLKPAGFRAGHRYPLVVHVHGGPHVMWSPAQPAMWLEWQQQAARGYVVFYCNPRGSDGYGEAHMRAVHNNWGTPAMTDVLAGVDAVVGRGYVDEDRLAISGGSYGGYMTLWIVGHDDRFAAAIAQRGVYNLGAFFGVTDIPHFIEWTFDGLPFDDMEHTWRQSPLAYIRNVRTPLLLIHSENDYRVPIAEAEQVFTALRKLKRPVQLVRYPRDGHELSRSGEPKHRVDRLNRMADWLDKYCQRPRARRRRHRSK